MNKFAKSSITFAISNAIIDFAVILIALDISREYDESIHVFIGPTFMGHSGYIHLDVMIASLLGLLAIVTGIIALIQIKKGKGKGIVIASIGITIGILGILLGVVLRHIINT